MTKQELVKNVGEAQASFATDILLKHIKVDFLRLAVKAELSEIMNTIREYEADGFIYMANGSYHVDWTKGDEIFRNAPFGQVAEDQEKEYEMIRERQHKADALIYRRNRTSSLLASLYTGEYVE